MQNFFDVIQNRSGVAIQGALVYVYNSVGGLATLYSNNGITTKTNPTASNIDGEYSFYAANGTYSLVISAYGYTSETRTGVVLFDPSESSANLTGPITSVGNATAIASQTGTGTTFVMSQSPTVNNLSYTGTLTGGTGVVNLGSGQLVKDAAGNVGIGVVPSGQWKLDLLTVGTGGARISTAEYGQFVVSDGPRGVYIQNYASAGVLGTSSANRLSFATDNVERMTIDTSGNLGIGTSAPSNRLHVTASAASTAIAAIYNTDTANGNGVYIKAGGSNAGKYALAIDNAAASSLLLLDASGNLGLGVTPSAWGSGFITMDIGSSTSLLNLGDQTRLYNNGYVDAGGTTRYKNTAAATLYLTAGGGHNWHIAPSGTAGNPISFTQAMTLDASGNLLVGKTSANDTVVGATLYAAGVITCARSSSSNSDLNLYVYSTGAAAARFYVGMGGTVYATSTTITAISDQRLKENIQDIDVGLDAIMALKPRKFDWKAGKGKDKKGDRGWIAQEFEQVFPDMVDTWADPAPEGEEPYKAVNADLIPVLVKAIQELKAEFDAYKATHP